MRGGFGHARQHLVHRERTGDPLGEVGEHLVWAGALTVHEPIRQPLESVARGLEDDRDQCCRDQRQDQIGLAARMNERADARDHRDVDDRDARAKCAVHQGPIDDQIDVVQPIAQDRDRHRGDECDQADQVHEAKEPVEAAD